MVLPNEASKLLIDKCPDLKKSEHWENYLLVCHTEEELKFTRLMNVLTDYVAELLKTWENINKKKELVEIFSLVEFFIKKGDQSVRNAAATCFLENLINYTSWGSLKPETFLPYLGEESKKYCKAWDEFTGVKTEGLWD